MQRACEGSTDYSLIINGPLPNRDAIRKNKQYKRELSRGLSLFNLGLSVTMDRRDDGAFVHDEAEVTLIAYKLKLQNLVRT